MKIMWCWRCKKDVPMLEEEEYRVISDLYYDCIKCVKKYRQENGTALSETPVDKLFEPVVNEYKKMTGMKCHHNAIMHHRISIYGPLCKSCGKPLRTPRAKLCAACRTPV